MSEFQPNNKLLKAKCKSKKQPKEKEGTPGVGGNDIKVNPSTVDASASSTATSPKALSAWAVSEIQRMMHGFGDARSPLLESAKLVESIVNQQMNSLLHQALDVSAFRGGKFIGMEDILFLMRKDKVKLSRLFRYLELKSLQGSVISGIAGDDDGAAAVIVAAESGAGDSRSSTPPRTKRTKICRDFLASIDQTGELQAIFNDPVFDEVKHERDVRAEVHTRCMDQAQYLEYSNARSSSFCAKNKTVKFREWLLKDLQTDVKVHSMALELLSYLAYETVAEIVDLALLVKKDSKSVPGDALSLALPPVMCNPEFPNVLIPNAPEKVAVGSSDSATLGKESTGTTSELAELECIMPAEIREAMRRYWKHRGPLTCFVKTSVDCPAKGLLCC